MPVFLAKDYLAEHQNKNLHFLTSTLLPVPNYLEEEVDYLQSLTDRFSLDITEHQNGIENDIVDDDLSLIFDSFKEKRNEYLLENYGRHSPTLPVADPNNIIQIDSDSDLGITSSFGSSIMGTDDGDLVNELVHPSLCSTEMNRDVSSDLLLEELDEEDSITLPLISILQMHRRLKPAKVSDPFRDILKSGKGLCKLAELTTDGNFRKCPSSFQFTKFCQMKEDEEFLLETEYFTRSQRDDNYEETIKKDFLGFFKKLSMEMIDEKMDLKEFMDTNSSKMSMETLETITDVGKENILDVNTPVSPEPHMKGKLDCPELSFVSSVTTLPELPKVTPLENDMEISENVVNTENMYVISPNRKEVLSKQIWSEEKLFGDILLMLLPEKDFKEDVLRLVNIDYPINCKNLLTHFDDESLEWDPLISSSNLIEAVVKGILEKVSPDSKKRKETCIRFQEIPSDWDNDDLILEDWKQQERKLQSLKYITCKESGPKNDIPSIKGCTNAPVGYHNPIIIDRKHDKISKKVDSEKLPLSQITPIPRMKDSLSTRKNKSVSPYESPLDSFMLLRKVKPGWNIPVDSESKKTAGMLSMMPQKMVSAAKVKPFMSQEVKMGKQHDDEKNCSTKESALMKNVEVQPTQNHMSKFPHLEGNTQNNTNVSEMNSIERSGDYSTREKGVSNLKTSSLETTVVGGNLEVIRNDDFNLQGKPNKKLKLDEQKTTVGDTDFVIENPTTSTNSSNERIETEQLLSFDLITIPLCHKYLSFIKDLSENLHSLLDFLRNNSRCITPEFSISMLTMEWTLFTVKQEEKKYKEDGSNEEVFCGALCLHALTQVIDNVLNCNILSACAILKAMTQKHEVILGNCLEPLHKKLLNFYCGSEESHVIHPKLKKMQYLLNLWFTENPMSNILIIVQRMYEFVAPNLQNFLSAIRGVRVNLYPSQDATENAFLDVFYKSNVILVHENVDIESCPWQIFNYVIQFEQRETQNWMKVAFSSNPNLKYIAFKSFTLDCVESSSAADGVNNAVDERTYTILCTPSVVKEKELLIALESKYNIQLCVKDYSKVKFNMAPEFSLQPDILIDEKTGVVLLFANDSIHTKEMFAILQNKLVSVVMKCSFVYLIIYKQPNGNEDLFGKLTSRVVSLLSVIHTEFSNVTCKILQTFSIKNIAKKIRILCDNAMNSSADWSNKQLFDGNWLKEEFSESEQFLLSYPFINSFCALSILRNVDSKKTLLKMSLDKLISVYPAIPRHVLEAFHRVNHTPHTPNILYPTTPNVNNHVTYTPNVYNATSEQNSHRLMDPTIHGSMDPTIHCSMDPTIHGSIASFEKHINNIINVVSEDQLRNSHKDTQQNLFDTHDNCVPAFENHQSQSSALKAFNFDRELSIQGHSTAQFSSHSNAIKDLTDKETYIDHEVPSINAPRKHAITQPLNYNNGMNHLEKELYIDHEVPSTNHPLNLENAYLDNWNISDRKVPTTSVNNMDEILYGNSNLSFYQETPQTIDQQDPRHKAFSSNLTDNDNFNFNLINTNTSSQDSVSSFKLTLPNPNEENIKLSTAIDVPFYMNSDEQITSSVINDNKKRSNNNDCTDMYSSMMNRKPLADIENFQQQTFRGRMQQNQENSTNTHHSYSSMEKAPRISSLPFNSTTKSSTSTSFPKLYNMHSGRDKNAFNNEYEENRRTNSFTNNMTTSTHFPNPGTPVPGSYYEHTNAREFPNYHHSNRRSVWEKTSLKEIPRQAVKAFKVSETSLLTTNKHSKSYSGGLNEPNSSSLQNCSTPGRYQNRMGLATPMSTNNEGNYPSRVGSYADVMNTPSMLSPSKSKKRKLTYQKVPGTKGGQTKLAFM